MTAKETTANHRRLARAGFRRHPDGSYYMPYYPEPRLNVTAPLESSEDLIELVYAWGYCEGRKDARTSIRRAMGVAG